MNDAETISAAEIQQRTQQSLQGVWARSSRIFRYVFPLQFVVVATLAFIVTPNTWVGETSEIHLHVWTSIGLGLLLCLVPMVLSFQAPDSAACRHATAIGQMAMAGLLVHVTGGRIESHFHYFAVLAILAFYRDYPVILTATVVAAGDHLVRGIFFPLSLYGLDQVSIWRVIEHATHVVFEDVFLVLGIWYSRREMNEASRMQLLTEQVLAQSSQDRDHARQEVADARSASEKREAEVAKLASDITGAVAELDDRVRLTAESAGSMRETMLGFSSVLATGGTAVDQTGQQLENVVRAAQEASSAIEDLARESAQINDITQLINSIAERTNLLSLNASVEASRAGDAGRGFAVVANEVKQLSSATVESTRQIEEVAASIRELSERALAAVAQNRQQVDQTLAQSRESRSSFETARSTVSELEVMVQSVANLNEQVQGMSASIAQHVKSVAQAG